LDGLVSNYIWTSAKRTRWGLLYRQARWQTFSGVLFNNFRLVMYFDINVTHDKIFFVTNTTNKQRIKFIYIQKYEDRISSVLRGTRKKS
jgi:hypothetical protein